MYDYMKALQERFDKKPPERLVRAVQSAREEVREGMDDEKRKKLLRLLDAQNMLLEEATLLSFTAGFKLAWGIAGELGAPYSYDTDEEQTVSSNMLETVQSVYRLFFSFLQAVPRRTASGRECHSMVLRISSQ